MFIKGKEKRNQILDKAEDIIMQAGFTGEMEKDLQMTNDPIGKQVYLVETLLYKYEHANVSEKPAILKKLEKEIQIVNKLLFEKKEDEGDLKANYEKILEKAKEKFVEKKFMYNGSEITIKAFPCGEYYDGEEFSPVTAKAIYMDDESLYEVVPTEGIWSVATRFQDLKLVSLGMFDDPRDAFGYIEYCCN